jgi:hypothetical protein
MPDGWYLEAGGNPQPLAKIQTMKKHLFSVVLLATGCWCSQAQIVLNSGDLPQVGDIQPLRRIDSTSTNPGPSGANQTWNFSSLSGGYVDTNYYVLPSATPNGASFPMANICILRENSNNYMYCSTGASGMKIVGFDDNPGAIDLDIEGFEFPILTYGNSITHDFRARFNVVSATTYDAIFVHHVSTADGWGTIATPTGSISVIRVHTVETSYDSSYVSGTGSQLGTSTGYYYRWYAKNLGWPVFEIAKGVMGEPNFERTMFATTFNGTGINELKTTGATLYPNPCTSQLNIETQQSLSNAILTIFTLTGETVFTQAGCQGNLVQVNLQTLPSGMYVCRITDADVSITASLIKQ